MSSYGILFLLTSVQNSEFNPKYYRIHQFSLEFLTIMGLIDTYSSSLASGR